jgi:hypothetical protein
MLGLERRDRNVENPLQGKLREVALKSLKQIVVTCHFLVNLVILLSAGLSKREADQVGSKQVSLVSMNLLDLAPPQLGCITLAARDPQTIHSAGHSAIFGIFEDAGIMLGLVFQKLFDGFARPERDQNAVNKQRQKQYADGYDYRYDNRVHTFAERLN